MVIVRRGKGLIRSLGTFYKEVFSDLSHVSTLICVVFDLGRENLLLAACSDLTVFRLTASRLPRIHGFSGDQFLDASKSELMSRRELTTLRSDSHITI